MKHNFDNKAYLDIETTGLDKHSNTVTQFGYKLKGEHHRWEKPSVATMVEEFKKLKEQGIEIVCHYGMTFDIPFLKAQGVHNAYLSHDTMVCAFVGSSMSLSTGQLSLKDLARDRFGDWGKDLDVITGLTQEAIEYFITDLDATEYVFKTWWPRVQDVSHNIYYFLMAIDPIYQEMSDYGTYLDEDLLQRMIDTIDTKITNYAYELKQIFTDKTGKDYTDLKLSSGPQLGKVLFDDLGLIPQVYTAKQKRATNKEAISKLIDAYPEHEFFEVYKVWRKYTDELKQLKTWQKACTDGKVHPRISPFGTKTGRTSCRNPNIQNLKAGEFRNIIKAPEGYKFFECDLSQAEVRVAAVYSEDANLLKAYHDKLDIHTYTAALMNNIPYADVTPKLRKQAKPIVFGLLYGMSAGTLKEYAKMGYGVEMTAYEAKLARDNYYKAYPKLLDYYDDIDALGTKHKQIVSLFGRSYAIHDIAMNRDGTVRIGQQQTRAAVNFPIQSVASDLTMFALWEVYNKFDHDELRPIATIHDAIIGYVKDDEHALKRLEEVIKIMEKPVMLSLFDDLGVPLVADAKIGETWGTDMIELRRDEEGLHYE